MKYDEDAVCGASQTGKTQVLQWWKNSGLEFKYSARAMDLASRNGHTQVLQWWMDSGYELRYSRDSISLAIEWNSPESLQWWMDSGLEIDWDSLPFKDATDVKVLEWWEGSGKFQRWLKSNSGAREAIRKMFKGVAPGAGGSMVV
ncbi:hypothetical protein DFJ73DRAFT_854253 [Zopfochytrium polystomum]|nr:hypothetical protein DFJ73DRAFT_856379 [Zopfochytrium polystomum]KAI9333480.1 hypothetical protein DFJ73DRAFT_854253 [Zopfochytrium polystomum]